MSWRPELVACKVHIYRMQSNIHPGSAQLQSMSSPFLRNWKLTKRPTSGLQACKYSSPEVQNCSPFPWKQSASLDWRLGNGLEVLNCSPETSKVQAQKYSQSDQYSYLGYLKWHIYSDVSSRAAADILVDPAEQQLLYSDGSGGAAAGQFGWIL